MIYLIFFFDLTAFLRLSLLNKSHSAPDYFIIWEDDGALVVYDSNTLEEVKRIPMKKPVGKYNVYNKIPRSEGTSH